MTMKDAIYNADLVADTLAINSVEAKMLMDSGATRLFISENFVDKLRCVTYPLEASLIIEVANQERVTINKICPNYDIECINKKVKLNSKDGTKVIFKGNKQDRMFFTATQMKRLLRQGCEAYLANVKYFKTEPRKIEDIHMVKEFPDIFHDELPGLPLDREIEFTIDLAPETEPVSKAPYRMALVEMKSDTTARIVG
ncbi:uncharacterized protein LOC141718747 [Apium graveolens]|uniref:uncharacterized protein LOC141718747 n=1 Tax=Apium graveolens TaxID=4045 RepID=UPI003D797CB8